MFSYNNTYILHAKNGYSKLFGLIAKFVSDIIPTKKTSILF